MKSVRTFVLASASLLSLASPAFAQDTAAKDADQAGFGNEDIVVQARRRDESQQDVPLVVNAVTAASIEKLNLREFQEIQTLVPGLNLASSANGIGAQASLRGVAYDVNASGNNGTIEFYLNDAPLAAGILFQSMFDVGQIEVLRGPQGTLRGRASPSGSITVTSHRPDMNEAGGYLTGTINDIGTRNLNGAINVPIIEGILALRVAGVYEEGDGNRVNSLNSTVDPYQKTRGGRISLRAEPVDFLSLSASYTATNRQVAQFDQVESLSQTVVGGPNGQALITAGDRQSVQFIPRRYEQDFKVWNWQAQARFAGQKLDYVGSVSDSKLDSLDPSDDGAFFGATYPLALRQAAQVTNTRSKQTTHELRLSNEERISGIFDYVVGGLYNKLDAPTSLVTQTPLFAGFFIPQAAFPNFVQTSGIVPGAGVSFAQLVNTTVTRPASTKEQSLFANVTAHLGEATELSAGTRYIDYKSTGSLTVGGVAVPAATQNLKTSHWIYSASLKHKFTPDIMAYASFGSSWRPGSATNPIQFRDLTNPGALLSSFYFPGDETSNSYEIGVKSTWLDNRLRVNVTAYRQDFKNYAFSAQNIYAAGTDAQGAQRVFLAAPALAVGVPAKVDGVEGEIDFRLSDRFSISGTASYALSKIKNGVVPCNNYGGGVPTYAQILAANNGQQIATCNVNYRAGTSAPFAATVQSEYNHPIGASMQGYIRGLMTFQGKSQNDPANTFDDIDSYAQVNLFAGIRDADGAWELTGYVKNVFNVERVLTRTAQPLGVSYQQLFCSAAVPQCAGVLPAGVPAITYGQSGSSAYRGITMTAPREFGATFTVRFGSR
ncbi:TonB-dependent receptor [Novosphingobium sp. PS1R-30]|uniref:TonB-dependent receptor n=1 Tax=Novosphingobium anseongense TaxID=3133436 RepID=A0ABU8RTH8_9SPHN|nr:MAG: TonB-dependent receptor [Novosphingobium sp.]